MVVCGSGRDPNSTTRSSSSSSGTWSGSRRPSVRAFEGGPEGLEVIAVGNDRPEGGDGEMIQEFWTD